MVLPSDAKLRATVTQRDPYDPLNNKVRAFPSDVEAALAKNIQKEGMLLQKLEYLKEEIRCDGVSLFKVIDD